MGGPWFTVQAVNDGWKQVDTLWLSNGQEDIKARIELRVSLEPFADSKHQN